MINDEYITSEEALTAILRVMPGGDPIIIASDVEAIEKKEVREAMKFLYTLMDSFLLKQLDYYPRELIKGRIEALAYELERYDS